MGDNIKLVDINLIGISGKKQHGKNTIANIIAYLTQSNKNHYSFINNDSWFVSSNWNQKSFAGKLKDMIALLLNVSKDRLEEEDYKNSTLWVHANTGKNITPRYIMQQLGTEFGRSIHPNLWIESLFSNYSEIVDFSKNQPMNKNWLITDMRFPNEAKAIKDKGGMLLRVFRPGQLQVWFQDPDSMLEDDEQDSSGYYYVQSIEGDVWSLSQYKDGTGSQIEGDIMYCLKFNESDNHISETALDSYEFDEVIINDGELNNLIKKVEQILIKWKIIE
jgi:hypothetical protein